MWAHLPGGRALPGVAVHALLYEGHDLRGAVLGGLDRVQLAPRGRVLGYDLPQQHRECKGVDLHTSESFTAAPERPGPAAASLTAALNRGQNQPGLVLRRQSLMAMPWVNVGSVCTAGAMHLITDMLAVTGRRRGATAQMQLSNLESGQALSNLCRRQGIGPLE